MSDKWASPPPGLAETQHRIHDLPDLSSLRTNICQFPEVHLHCKKKFDPRSLVLYSAYYTLVIKCCFKKRTASNGYLNTPQ